MQKSAKMNFTMTNHPAIRIGDFMKRDVIFLRQDETLADAYDKMNNHHIRHLPVLDRHNKVVGVFTYTDLYRAHSPRQTEEGWWYYDKDELRLFILSHFMTKDPVLLTPEDTLKQAAEIMAREKFGCIPIVDQNSKELLGIISYVDVLQKMITLL